MTNNAAKRALRGVALGRESWLYAGSDRGGDRTAFMHSLFVTARMNDNDPRVLTSDTSHKPGQSCRVTDVTTALSHYPFDQIAGTFGNHDGRRIGVARSDPRHDRRVNDPKSADPVDTQLRIDDCAVVRSHSGCPDRMEDGRGNLPRTKSQFLVTHEGWAGLELFRSVSRQW